ncbi:exopolyphosphatase / guanosine-5'-triphosphate,3'-diphosphate pyrophosphatase [Natronincola peptidivorans]|uniref:Exopolyphosphatase / guanosine-5'-triphosphate,3'-diphosphate pyrophosphatase n=1 Tax=Natronincola peptidivorans TaxID=426128 RepID=A0A1I0CSR5_9FIRM|nr:Ppx/GppA phosphatase family protein [Natronincola peptidivorans]SET22398.1 exopolyphosphatase / guanosine-5'-triphosphate,3'-diphosphate pyrophosphatase [Natronincola peptidivorans]
MKKYAVIDIGTNSMRLLLAEVEGASILHRKKEINTTRIGQSVDAGGAITQEGIEKNLSALQVFAEKAKAYGAEAIYAIATSAVRDAKNGKAFVKSALEKTGIKIEVITGEEEAELGFKGVLMGGIESAAEILVIDIGGGSTEFILGSRGGLQEVISENVGAVRITERIGEEEDKLHKAVEEILHNTLHRLKNKEIHQLIGTGGTITTLAALHQALDPYDTDRVHNYSLTIKDIEAIKDQLISLTIEERRKLKGIHPKRADIIIAGVMILYVVMKALDITTITVSEYDNLEGVLYNKLQSTIL